MNQDTDVKDDLKNIIRGYLDKAASSLFVDKSLAIIDESADNKESFMAVALRISKRTALFIDKDLAQTVYERLMAAIVKIASPQGTRRRYRRVAFRKKVRVRYGSEHYELDSENLSEGGMFIRTKEPFPVGSEIEITLPLVASRIHLTGVVVHKKDPFDETSKLPPGMAIEFKEIGDKETEMLRSYTQTAPAQAAYVSNHLTR